MNRRTALMRWPRPAGTTLISTVAVLFGVLYFGVQAGGLSLDAQAAPGVPDVDSLADDSGPLPGGSDTSWARDLIFSTPSGVTCKKDLWKASWQVVCAGDLPGAPPGMRVVTLYFVAGGSNGSAQFLATPPERLIPADEAQAAVPLPAGHKMVFFASGSDQTLVCGVPVSADLVCVARSGPDSHGFVITSAQSRVF